MTAHIVYYSRFMPSCDQGGGSRRMTQIARMIQTVYPHAAVISSARGDGLPRERRIRVNDRSLLMGADSSPAPWSAYRKWSGHTRGVVYRLREYSAIWAESLASAPLPDLALMDDPIFFTPLFKALRKRGVPVAAVCHNIETLAARQVQKHWGLELLGEELKLLSQCRLIVSISREETFLLNNLGMEVEYLPYYPPEPVLGRLCAVRRRRAVGERKAGILMTGNAKNVQTRTGMIAAAHHWSRGNLHQLAGPLIIGGYNSEEFLDPRPWGGAVDFRGVLSAPDMDDLLSRVRAFLCFQDTGAGALTRIAEMLIAGVPVLANPHAARSYHHRPGVLEYRDWKRLEEMLPQADPDPADIPPPEAPDPARCLERIAQILREGRR